MSFAETNTNDLEAAKKEARKVAVAKSNSVIEVEAGMPVRKPLKNLTRPWTIHKGIGNVQFGPYLHAVTCKSGFVL